MNALEKVNTDPPWVAQLKAGRRLHSIRLPSQKARESPVAVHHCQNGVSN